MPPREGEAFECLCETLLFIERAALDNNHALFQFKLDQLDAGVAHVAHFAGDGRVLPEELTGMRLHGAIRPAGHFLDDIAARNHDPDAG